MELKAVTVFARFAILLATSYCCPALAAAAGSQIQAGTVKGTVTDQAGARLAGVKVTLDDPITGFRTEALTDPDGAFGFDNVAFEQYTLRVAAAGFRPFAQAVSVRSNIPVSVDIKLAAAGVSESVVVEPADQLVEPDSTSTETDIDQKLINQLPGPTANRRLQQVIASTPGWAAENNGLLHIRGVDDGILYVVGGVPTSDRIDSAMGSGLDPDAIRSINVMTGNIPAEFGGRSGAVVSIQPKSGIDLPATGGFAAGAAGFAAREVSANAAGGIAKKLGYFVDGRTCRSDRWLDPVAPENFHNRGGSIDFYLRNDWHPTPGDIVIFSLSFSGTGLQQPNSLQQQTAGQRQRQELRDDDQSIMWQRTWSPAAVTNISYFRRYYSARLIGNPFDTPLLANQDRRNARQGINLSVSKFYRGHTIKAGAQAERLTPREFFEFAVTDRGAAADADISEPAIQFDIQHPFAFRDRKTRGLASWFIQDAFSPFKGLTLNAGLRYDFTSLLEAADQFSPRFGAVYYVARSKTALRASFNRLYMPPQLENLLLADSQQARELSPFSTGPGGGGAAVMPERVSAYELGFAQDLFGLLRLDAALWWRRFNNIDDPNVLFNTTIIFPNSVARAMAHGLDLRLDLKEKAGWSGYLSYGNSRILEVGPINGGLFLTNDFADIAAGTRFIPDHDQRNQGSFALAYHHHKSGLWASVSGTYESGVPVNLDPEKLSQLESQPGAELVDFKRGRVKPRKIFNVSAGVDLFRDTRVAASAQFDVQNIGDERFAYNFGNPFSGTHFGYPRLYSARIRITFR
jgi:outer membrane receptor protein involved in Fe transport